MPKRLADEAVTNDLVAAAQATASQIPPSDGTSNIPTNEQSFHRNSHKRLHLISSPEVKNKPARSVHNDNSNQTSNKSSLMNTTNMSSQLADTQPMESPPQESDKLGLISRDLDAPPNEMPATEKQDQQQERPHQDELGDARVRDTSKHLVKTVLDLPVFVTIEGYRVASYSIDGEPHLCLPQLLQFIQQKFPLDRVIDKFEESLTNFISATPKQIEGFIKAIVLPQDATACPLIKRSDAEWVCLALYDQQTKEKWGNIVDLCSKSDPPSRKESDFLVKKESVGPNEGLVNKNSSIATGARTERDNQNQEKTSAIDGPSDQSIRASSGKLSTEILSVVEHQHKAETATHIDKTTSYKDSPHYNTPSTNEKSSGDIEVHKQSTEYVSSHQNGQKLFESEAQDTILNLVRSVTSTLMIQVYHRCFGKCVGLYYPSLLKTSESDCIECSSCHKMLSPRRFIGHTHEAKELNVCHWGFNSYHWRNYIRLSRKQSMNNLDDDELLVQFNLLKSMPDESIDAGSNFQETSSGAETNSSSCGGADIAPNSIDIRLPRQSRSHGAASHQTSRAQLYNADLINNLSAKPSTSRAAIEKLVQLPPPPPPPPTASGSHLQVSPSSIPRYDQTPDKNPYLWNVDQASVASVHKPSLPGCMSLLSESKQSKYYPNSLMYGPFTPSLQNTSVCYPSSPMSRSNHNMTSLNFLSQMYGDSLGLAHSASEPVCSALNQSATDRLIKQDVFVSTSLTKHLHSKGIHPKVAEDIVNSTLGFIQRSRTLF